MGVLNIRNLPDEIHAGLRIRAAKAGRSMEAEARAIIVEAINKGVKSEPASSLQDLVEALYGDAPPPNVVDDLIAERRREALRE